MRDPISYRRIHGSCHCGNIRVTFDWPDSGAIPVRACGCGLCAKHRAAWTSHPDGRFHLRIADKTRVTQYRFGTKTADFHVCLTCGAIPIVTCMIEGIRYAVFNVNTFDDVDRSEFVETATNFEGETTENRLARRRRNWTPENIRNGCEASMTASALERKTSERVRISVGKNGTTTWMPQELLFELKDARVTPHIATFGGTSYQIATIGSVHVARRKRSNPFAVLTFLLGLGVLAAAIVKSRMTGLADEYFSMAVTGVAVMLAALLLQLIWPGRVYVLVLRTSSGDVDAVTSRNKEFVSNLQKAVEQAFLVRAREPPVSEAGGSTATSM